MTLIAASGSEVLTDHKPLNLGSSANVLLALVFRDLSFTAVMKCLVQYSKPFDLGYSFSFGETGRNDVPTDRFRADSSKVPSV